MSAAAPPLQTRLTLVLATVSIFEVFEVLGIGGWTEPVTQQMLCPFHADSSPSARVYAEENRVYCFTCGRGWDTVAVVATHEGLTPAAAVTWLERQFAIPGATDRLFEVVRATVRRAPPPGIEPSFSLVDQLIRDARARLPMDRYNRACLALDQLYAQATAHSITAAQFQQGAGRVLRYLT